MRVETLYKKGSHSELVIGRDADRRHEVIDTNQYFVQHQGRGLLLDPGSMENFSGVAAALSRHFDLANVEAIFASHQDPDVISSLTLWLQSNPELVVYVPQIWLGFITHFGVSHDNLHPIPDGGGVITLGGSELEVIPAHYLHSPGNMSLYDPESKILFSGDIGSALLPEGEIDLFVGDFNEHSKYMEYFHRRWMASNTAKLRWIAQVRKHDVKMICPQHGSIFRDDDVERFLRWFESIDVGSGWHSLD